MKRVTILLLAILVNGLAFGQQNDDDDDDFNDFGNANVTASRLPGAWQMNSDISERLQGRKPRKTDTVTFIVDTTVKRIIPAVHLKKIKGKKIYLSGYVIFENDRYPFLLIDTDGNTRLLYFRDKQGVKYGDGESFLLFIAVSKNKQKDLLFTGGDFNNESFNCWERIK